MYFIGLTHADTKFSAQMRFITLEEQAWGRDCLWIGQRKAAAAAAAGVL